MNVPRCVLFCIVFPQVCGEADAEADPLFFPRPDSPRGSRSSCRRLFFPLDFADAERRVPFFSKCIVSRYAVDMQAGLAHAPCAARTIDEAELIIVPGYAALQKTYPKYSDHSDSVVRLGHECRDNATAAAYRKLSEDSKLRGKTLVLLDAGWRVWSYEFPEKRVYAHPRYIWAMLGARTNYHRFGIDVSIPHGPSEKLNKEAAHRSFMEPLESKRFLASFKGAFRRNPWRSVLANLHHDGDRVIIAESSDSSYDYSDLLFSSVFSLLLPGDREATYRFNEAVCSGGIPVLVTRATYIPPFEGLLRFESYGVVVLEADAVDLVRRLESIGKERRRELRAQAFRMCTEHFMTIQGHADTLALALTGGAASTPPAESLPDCGRAAAATLNSEAPQLRRDEKQRSWRRECKRKLFPLTFAEAEELAPQLRACPVSLYAVDLQRALMSAPCIAPTIEEANVVIVPAYGAEPYEGRQMGARDPDVQLDAGCRLRSTRACPRNASVEGYRRLSSHRSLVGKRLLLLGFAASGLHADRALWRPQISWMLRGARASSVQEDAWHWVSYALPPRPGKECSGVVAARSFLEKFDSKRHLVSFAGQLRDPGLRASVAKLHNGEDVIIFDRNRLLGETHESFLFSSKFVLVIPDEDGMAPNFNDAVCSGGIPVLVGDTWRVPFEELIPFEQYGIRLSERLLPSLPVRLRSLRKELLEPLREAARQVCTQHLQTLEHQAASIARRWAWPTSRHALPSRGSLGLQLSFLTSHDQDVYGLVGTALWRVSQNEARRVSHRTMPLQDFALFGGHIYGVHIGDGRVLKQALVALTPENPWTDVVWQGPASRLRIAEDDDGALEVLDDDFQVALRIGGGN